MRAWQVAIVAGILNGIAVVIVGFFGGVVMAILDSTFTDHPLMLWQGGNWEKSSPRFSLVHLSCC